MRLTIPSQDSLMWPYLCQSFQSNALSESSLSVATISSTCRRQRSPWFLCRGLGSSASTLKPAVRPTTPLQESQSVGRLPDLNTQSPWLLCRGLRSDAQSEPMASCRFLTTPLQGSQSVRGHFQTIFKKISVIVTLRGGGG